MDWTTVSRSKKRTPVNRYNPRLCMIESKINPISLQSLIRKRIEMKLNQDESDLLCAFPHNTFKNIESNRIIPTEEQKQCIRLNFNVYLES